MYQEIYWTDLDDLQMEMNRLHNGKQLKRYKSPLLRQQQMRISLLGKHLR